MSVELPSPSARKMPKTTSPAATASCRRRSARGQRREEVRDHRRLDVARVEGHFRHRHQAEGEPEGDRAVGAGEDGPCLRHRPREQGADVCEWIVLGGRHVSILALEELGRIVPNCEILRPPQEGHGAAISPPRAPEMTAPGRDDVGRRRPYRHLHGRPDRREESLEAVRRHRRRLRALLHRPGGTRDRVRRAERGRQVDDDADDPRARPTERRRRCWSTGAATASS